MPEFSKHLLILTPGFPHTEDDSSNVPYLQDFILALKNRIGADKIKIITLHYPYTKKKYLWHNIEVIPAGGRNKKGFRKLFLMYRVFGIIKKLSKQNNFVLHSFWLTDAAMIGQISGRKYGWKHICTAMGQDVKPENKFLQFLNTELTTVITLSSNQEEIFFESTGNHSYRTIPLPIPDIDKNHITEQRDIDVLFVGSFISLKQPPLFIIIIKKLKEKFPQLKSVMIGEGPMLEGMKKIVDAESLNDTIQFEGKLERSKVFELMRRSKILLHTSVYEGQCLVFSEALAHGMYVVSHHVGRIEDSGKHVICWSEEELFLKCEELLYSKMNFEPYRSLDTDVIVEQYLKLYNEQA